MQHLRATRRTFLAGLTAAFVGSGAGEWIELFDGHSLNNWRPSEHKNSWKVQNGALAADGPRSHLFYAGPVNQADFKNFELEVEVLAHHDCNSGVYFHTRYQETGFPEKGFEIQINNTASGEGTYRERKKTGSLYGLRNVYKQFIPDDQWFKINASVRGKRVQVLLNGMLVVDYVEPTPPVIPAADERERYLDHGTFALQCHNEGSRALFRSVRVRPLPDNIADASEPAPVVDETFRDIINIGRHNVPMVDYNVHLRNGLTLQSALTKSRRDGIEYGFVASAASLSNDDAARRWLNQYQGQPLFLGLQADVPGWTRLFSRQTVARFDYTISDAATWTDNHGQSVSLADSRFGSVTDPQEFMETLLKKTTEAFAQQPIDIYASPTALPNQLTGQHDALWTETRMKQLIEAAAKNQVSIELNGRRRLPRPAFVTMAKEAGCKFCFGTDNQGLNDLERCDYGIQIFKECKLDWPDFFTPGSLIPRAVDRRGDLLRS